MQSKLGLISIILALSLLCTLCIGDVEVPTSSGGGGSTLSDVAKYQRGIDYGYKTGYLAGYQAGKADVLSNQTTTMTNISQGLAELLQTSNEQSSTEERSPVDWNLTLIILATGLILSILIAIPVYKSKNPPWEDNSIRLLGIVWVIIGGLVLLPVGYSEQQIAPLWAMLGTIAGYLLAKF
jgi:hypothetical protein